ncbi:MAG: RimK/LysX family protein [Planctomycetota bacterium]
MTRHHFNLKSKLDRAAGSIHDPALELKVVGWQESVGLPDFSIDRIVAKLDSGAAHSVLHVDHPLIFRRGRANFVRFELTLENDSADTAWVYEAPVVGMRRMQSSSGHISIRPIIATVVYLAGYRWAIDLSLTDRSKMQFPLLLGRSALAGRCLVDSGRAHLTSVQSAYRTS